MEARGVLVGSPAAACNNVETVPLAHVRINPPAPGVRINPPGPNVRTAPLACNNVETVHAASDGQVCSQALRLSL